jgi:TetR/AcrR family transcriptional regulator, transcriptional repressor for nem operon
VGQVTDSVAIEEPLSKRERLVEGARDALYEQGVERTTIADVARAAEVPLGNVYYYFKTKDELIAAVIERHLRSIEALLAALEHHRSPAERLKALVRALTDEHDSIVEHGCPLGSLCFELDKRNDAFGRRQAPLLQLPIDWATEQFRALGARYPHDQAVALIAAYQGIALLTNTLGDPDLMAREARRLERWIDQFA